MTNLIKTLDYTDRGNHVLSTVLKDGKFIDKKLHSIGLGIDYNGGLGFDYFVSTDTPVDELIRRLEGIDYTVEYVDSEVADVDGEIEKFDALLKVTVNSQLHTGDKIETVYARTAGLIKRIAEERYQGD